jgi:chromosome partitioning protein
VATTVAVANQKGGVGKTTTATTLAHVLGLMGRRVLLVDVDPQGNATSGVGARVADRSPAFTPPGDGPGPVPTDWQGVHCLPAGRDLESLADRATAATLRENLARAAPARFDVVLLDCPPSLGPLTRSALAASDHVLIPIQCEYYPLEGLVQLLAAVRRSRTETHDLAVAGVLFTMYDPAAALTAEVESEVRGKLDEPVLHTVIPRDPAVAEAPSHCLSVLDYAPRSPGARAYAELGLELAADGGPLAERKDDHG